MDTSETYIKMCKKAEEIQKEWKGLEGDYFYQDCYGFSVRICWESGDMRFACRPYPNFPIIWLPRQDQLQGIVEDDLRIKLFDNKAHMTLKIFYDAVNVSMNSNENEYYWQFASMEQLWLTFVMKEKFKKQWDGKEWIRGGLG